MVAANTPGAAKPQPDPIGGVYRHKKAQERAKSMPFLYRGFSCLFVANQILIPSRHARTLHYCSTELTKRRNQISAGRESKPVHSDESQRAADCRDISRIVRLFAGNQAYSTNTTTSSGSTWAYNASDAFGPKKRGFSSTIFNVTPPALRNSYWAISPR